VRALLKFHLSFFAGDVGYIHGTMRLAGTADMGMKGLGFPGRGNIIVGVVR
jgi:hypothetical protein